MHVGSWCCDCERDNCTCPDNGEQQLDHGLVRSKANAHELQLDGDSDGRTPMDYDEDEGSSQCGPRYHASYRPDGMHGDGSQDEEDEPEYWSETEIDDQEEGDEEDEDFQELQQWAARPYRSILPGEQARAALAGLARTAVARMNGTTTEL